VGLVSTEEGGETMHQYRRKQEELEKRLQVLEWKQAGLTDDEIRAMQNIQRAGRAKLARRDFNGHLAAYIVVNAMLWVGMLTMMRTFPFWMIFVTVGWGIGLVAHWAEYRRLSE
jgi:hypothetical protein